MATKKVLEGQVALVTGAAVRIGRAIALALGEQGATVAVHYHSHAAAARRVVAQVRAKGGQAEAFQADLSDDGECASLIPTVHRDLGAVHILINNASLFKDVLFPETTVDDWDAEFAVNLKGAFRLSQCFAAQNHSRVRGSIINISDWRGLRPGPDHFPYTVSKAALIKMTEAMALALAPRIRVNCVALGSILPPPNATPALVRRLAEATPLKHMGSPRDVTSAILYLLGPGSYVTGETIAIDGGRRLVT